MRSRKNFTVSAPQVHQWALQWLVAARLLKTPQARSCTVDVVWNVVLQAATRMISIYAACVDLVRAPSSQAVYAALGAGLPKTLSVLERRLNESLTQALPRRLRRRCWNVAIDWHLVPYYGKPARSRNELYYGKPKQGTKHFHAYATACIVQHGERYTLALSWVRRHESMVTVLSRLLRRLDELGLKSKVVLLDRAFFNVAVAGFLKERGRPFLMPVVFRGRKAKKKNQPRQGLRWIEQQRVGRYPHTLKNRQRQVTISVVVAYRTHKNRKDGRRVQQKLLFGAWRVPGSPQHIRHLYRTRFGIESSYRQLRQARIYTCTRCPRLRLLFVAVALMLRNLWVWIHDEKLSERRGDQRTVRLQLFRLKRMFAWIAQAIAAQLHDGSTFSIEGAR